MGFIFARNTKNVKEIFDDFEQGKLIIDTSYQRRKVWMLQDKIRLIETILMGLIVPEVFFWPSKIDADTGDMVTHIVDGQQRIDAIVEYISGEYSLLSRYRLNDNVKVEFENKKFDELSNEAKTRIWTYRLSVVDIDSKCIKTDITQMFYRLNLTNYSLNSQEKRNSVESKFGEAAEGLSQDIFWKENKVFSSADARRMRDVEYCASIYILAREGIVDQTNGKKINEYYDDFKESFDDDEKITNQIFAAMEIIRRLTDNVTLQFVSKKAQMYTMFCMAFRMLDKGINVNDETFKKFKMFVVAYNGFKNEYDIHPDDAGLSYAYEGIKKYKLASSEGVNKISNRVLRLEVLNDFCVESDSSIINAFEKLAAIFEENNRNKIGEFEAIEKDEQEE